MMQMNDENSAYGYFESLPLDIVLVVRCKECKHYVSPEPGDFLGLCTDGHLAVSNMGEICPEEDYFCPYGERR